ncbi:hypothetical protein F5Y06DRAFT_261195 [Hypoxylon sp. FL0890]|nr:hypothetical protein F5Y06DRAFT_261195 [Hypoxylon sp. FL0890]
MSSTGSYPQVVHVRKSLHRATTIQDPTWDRAAVRRSVDLVIPTCDKLIDTLGHLKVASTLVSPDGGENESRNLGPPVFRKIGAACQSELKSMDAANAVSREVSMVDGTLGGCATFVKP